ncbi:hypothetical protein TRFO_28425 [Tritrichomonas foetus]|uniref:Uncharacterized protein n=1 Tax=Tritrichomonas foetus TaxID=1144522 RepID=A0A1J4JY33_9EUKA|nr:hypothetical protein TRFO_28425 [Tritrichomonas foetus]|eukprot:OHT04071.1 hypothetical protein TRFO_28425 [Tritrichomonas foetus]
MFEKSYICTQTVAQKYVPLSVFRGKFISKNAPFSLFGFRLDNPIGTYGCLITRSQIIFSRSNLSLVSKICSRNHQLSVYDKKYNCRPSPSSYDNIMSECASFASLTKEKIIFYSFQNFNGLALKVSYIRVTYVYLCCYRLYNHNLGKSSELRIKLFVNDVMEDFQQDGNRWDIIICNYIINKTIVSIISTKKN